MAVRENSEDPKLCFNGTQQYMLFDHSKQHSITALYSKPQTHFGNMKYLAPFDALEKTNSFEISDTVDEDSDMKSDAESSCFHQEDAADDPWELLYEEGTRKKLELLAGMVGIDSAEPGAVLAEVVRVLKGLKRVSGYQLHK